MSKKLVIDLNKWTTIKQKAASTIGKSGKSVSTEYICNQIRKKKLKGWKIEELGITLVEK